ncbi:BA14K family protein [Phenylobacterium sp.]|uniref:BA14K family protein n=1 Tax=Phenylobacterium sp. TaxID=1871053 RepID=UPI003524FC7D
MRKHVIMGLAVCIIAASAGAASAQPRPMGDRDQDGVPNAYDPRNDNRAPMGDRDRDGVPNAYDSRNNNRGPMGDRDHDGRPNAIDNHDDRWNPRWGREVAPPRHWRARAGWNRHVNACFNRYRSYNPRTDTYVVRRGVVARCRL